VDLKQLASFFAFNPASRAGFSIGMGDVNGDGFSDVIAGDGAGDPAQVRVFSGLTHFAIQSFFVNDSDPNVAASPVDVGVRVGAADVNGDGIDDVLAVKGPGSPPIVRLYQTAKVDPVTHAVSSTLLPLQPFNAFDGLQTYGLYIGASD
jgi:hypothetical protein